MYTHPYWKLKRKLVSHSRLFPCAYLEKQKHLADLNGRKIMLEFIEVEEIEEVEEVEDVFDIEVEDNHNFFANGLLVHNCQHLVNQHLIEASKRTGSKLVVTCDSHYSRPEHWREREIYKAMAWMNIQKDNFDKDTLPKHVSELKCELYPKNAQQVWDTYKETTNGKSWDFYDDQVVKDAIERTHDIAHNQLSEVHPDRSVKLPALHRIVGLRALEELYGDDTEATVDEDTIAFKALKQKAIEGLVWRKKQEDQVYIDRLRHELEVVKHLKFSKYFLTYSKVMEIVSETQLLGLARGSAAGSLLSYVLNITQVDPVKHNLLFERFLVKNKKCLDPHTYVITEKGIKTLKDITIGDSVLTHDLTYKQVTYKEESLHEEVVEFELENGNVLISSTTHKWIVMRNGFQQEVLAKDILDTDEFITKTQVENLQTMPKQI